MYELTQFLYELFKAQQSQQYFPQKSLTINLQNVSPDLKASSILKFL